MKTPTTSERAATSHPMRRTRRATAMVGAALLAATLGGCAAADPDDIEWEKVRTQGIVAIDDSTGIYVTGGFFTGVDSEQKIDYKFARTVDGGGLRQSMVSDLYEDVPLAHDYPGAEVVTIHHDIDGTDEKPRIEVYECTPNSEFKDCAMPDGSDMHGRFRVDIHVPKGAVVEADSLDAPTDK